MLLMDAAASTILAITAAPVRCALAGATATVTVRALVAQGKPLRKHRGNRSIRYTTVRCVAIPTFGPIGDISWMAVLVAVVVNHVMTGVPMHVVMCMAIQVPVPGTAPTSLAMRGW